MSLLKKLKSIFINDILIENVTGSNIIINGSKVIIDGVDCTPDLKNINIVIDGDVQNLQIGACNNFQITGNVDKLKTSSADVTITGNSGSIESSNGKVTVHKNVEGSVTTSNGNVTAQEINGSVKTTNGNIKSGSIKF